MGNRDQTRERLLEVGRRMFLEKGYNGTGLDAILRAAGVPKGSFYYYFASKEAFGLAVVESFAKDASEDLEATLRDEQFGHLERLRRYFEAAAVRFEAGQCRSGCLVGKLGQEMAEQSEVFRALLAEALGSWTDRVIACLIEAQNAGELRPDLDPRALGQLLTDGWQGVLLRAKTLQRPEPLRTFLDLMFGTMLRAPEPASSRRPASSRASSRG